MTDLQTMLKLLKKAGTRYKKYRTRMGLLTPPQIRVTIDEGCRCGIEMSFDLRGNILRVDTTGF